MIYTNLVALLHFLDENAELLTCNLNIICIQYYFSLLIGDDFSVLLPKNIISLCDWYLSLPL